ncbi:hypothetical protein HK101_011638 [Irineochytrium annulatum]|nr:hypothetical protein HK101_011638 [Irineochytrium annulatum]
MQAPNTVASEDSSSVYGVANFANGNATGRRAHAGAIAAPTSLITSLPPAYEMIPLELSDAVDAYLNMSIRIFQLHGVDDHLAHRQREAENFQAGMNSHAVQLAELSKKLEKGEQPGKKMVAAVFKGKSRAQEEVQTLQDSHLRSTEEMYKMTKDYDELMTRITELRIDAEDLNSQRDLAAVLLADLFEVLLFGSERRLNNRALALLAKTHKLASDLVSHHAALRALDSALAIQEGTRKAANENNSLAAVARVAENQDLAGLYLQKACALVPRILTEALPVDHVRMMGLDELDALNRGNLRAIPFAPIAKSHILSALDNMQKSLHVHLARLVDASRLLHLHRVNQLESHLVRRAGGDGLVKERLGGPARIADAMFPMDERTLASKLGRAIAGAAASNKVVAEEAIGKAVFLYKPADRED